MTAIDSLGVLAGAAGSEPLTAPSERSLAPRLSRSLQASPPGYATSMRIQLDTYTAPPSGRPRPPWRSQVFSAAGVAVVLMASAAEFSWRASFKHSRNRYTATPKIRTPLTTCRAEITCTGMCATTN